MEGTMEAIGHRNKNVGKSNYAKKKIQPWDIWLEYPELTSWDHDIIKRVLRTKEGESRLMEYEKIIHVCEERIRQLLEEEKLAEMWPKEGKSR